MTVPREEKKKKKEKDFSKCIEQISYWKTTSMVKRTPLVGKKLRNEEKICLLFQSVFLNFSNEEYIYLLNQIVCEIIRIAFGC